MSKEMVISANRHETKVAILEDDQLVEIFFQRANEYSLAGSIHKGRVTRVLPGMQSAFVDLGLERDTFLYVSDFFEENDEYDRILPAKEEKQVRPEKAERPEKIVFVEAVIESGTLDEPALLPSEDAPEGGPDPALSAPASASIPPRSAAPAGERRDDAIDRDQRGRRSRRRRNRGRGFPDSKYASEATEATEPLKSAPAVQTERAVEEYEFPMLPGESLAKYTKSGEDSVPDPEESAAESRRIEARWIEDDPSVPDPVVEQAIETAPMEAEEHSAPFGGAAAALEPETHEETRSGSTDHSVQPSAIPTELLETEAADDIPDTLEDAFLPIDLDDPAEEDRDPVRDPEEPAGLENESSVAVHGEETLESAQTGETEGRERSASVREPGGRYMHRMPRRTRRKQRGGGGTQLAEGVSAAAAEPTPVVKPEPAPQRAVVKTERVLPSITELLKEGQEILVQIAKEPLGQKGARITSHIALPGRYVVYMPTLEHMGVSRKIASDDERLRLKRILQAHRAGVQGGFIVRTAGEGKTEEEILADMNFLANLWLDIKQKSERKPAPLLLHHDLDIVQRILRDQMTDNFKSIWVDNEDAYESILRFVQRFQPALVTRVKMYTRSAPVFDAFNITQELEKALRPKVWLKSGGYIVINQTEALVAIDVNTGKYVGKSNRLEDTIVKTNTEAVKEIVRQIRLRDLGGIIVVDFIDMDERKNRQKVMLALEEAMRADKAPYKILQFNDFGLVAITRKRVKQSLERALCSPCTYCEGAGYVKSVQTTVSEILQEAQKIARAVEGKDVLLRVHPEVAKFLKSNQNKYLEEMEEVLRRPVLVKADPLLHQEKFDLA